MSARTILFATLAGASLLAAVPAQAQWDAPHDGWRERAWREEARERAWREQQWREQRWREHEWRRREWVERHRFAPPPGPRW